MTPAPLNRFVFFSGCLVQQSSWTCPGFLQWLQVSSPLAGMEVLLLPELLPFRPATGQLHSQVLDVNLGIIILPEV